GADRWPARTVPGCPPDGTGPPVPARGSPRPRDWLRVRRPWRRLAAGRTPPCATPRRAAHDAPGIPPVLPGDPRAAVPVPPPRGRAAPGAAPGGGYCRLPLESARDGTCTPCSETAGALGGSLRSGEW